MKPANCTARVDIITAEFRKLVEWLVWVRWWHPIPQIDILVGDLRQDNPPFGSFISRLTKTSAVLVPCRRHSKENRWAGVRYPVNKAIIPCCGVDGVVARRNQERPESLNFQKMPFYSLWLIANPVVRGKVMQGAVCCQALAASWLSCDFRPRTSWGAKVSRIQHQQLGLDLDCAGYRIVLLWVAGFIKNRPVFLLHPHLKLRVEKAHSRAYSKLTQSSRWPVIDNPTTLEIPKTMR